MESRIAPEQPLGPDPTPRTLTVGDRSVPFASRNHSGWRAFYERIDREHNSYTNLGKHLNDPDDEFRRILVGLALDDVVNQEGPLSEEAQHYLSSFTGFAEWLVEGICLGDSSRVREQVKEEVGEMVPSHIQLSPDAE